MKKALKWLALGVAGLIGSVVLFSADKQTQLGLMLLGFAYWVYMAIYKDVQEARARVAASLERIERRLEQLENQPIFYPLVSDGLEGLAHEYRDRKKAMASDPHSP